MSKVDFKEDVFDNTNKIKTIYNKKTNLNETIPFNYETLKSYKLGNYWYDKTGFGHRLHLNLDSRIYTKNIFD